MLMSNLLLMLLFTPTNNIYSYFCLAAAPPGAATTIAYYKGLAESVGVCGAGYLHFKELNALFDRASRKYFEIVNLG